MNDWEKYREAAEKGPMSIFWKVLLPSAVVICVIWIVGYGLGWFGEAGKVVKEEFAPKAALEKYEWFINQANMIEKMDQDIAIFEQRLKDIEKRYQTYGEDKAKWPMHIQVQYNKEQQTAYDDLVAVVSQRNNLVREYNASSEKFNWKPFQTRPDKPKERFHDYKTLNKS